MAHELEALWQRFSLTKEEDEEVDLGSNTDKSAEQKHYLVGRIIT